MADPFNWFLLFQARGEGEGKFCATRERREEERMRVTSKKVAAVKKSSVFVYSGGNKLKEGRKAFPSWLGTLLYLSLQPLFIP